MDTTSTHGDLVETMLTSMAIARGTTPTDLAADDPDLRRAVAAFLALSQDDTTTVMDIVACDDRDLPSSVLIQDAIDQVNAIESVKIKLSEQG